MARSGTTTSARPWTAPPKRARPGNARSPRTVGRLRYSRFPGLGADLARPEHAPHAAHERDQRHPRRRPGRRDHRGRHGKRRLYHGGRLCSRGLWRDERSRRLLGYEPDAKHVSSTETKSEEEEGVTLAGPDFFGLPRGGRAVYLRNKAAADAGDGPLG